MSKNIWILNQTAGTPDSGWGERHYFLSKYWVEKGYKTTIFSGSYNHLFNNQPKKSNKTFTKEEIEKGITFCWVKIKRYNPNSIFKLWSMIIFAWKILFIPSKEYEKPDIVIISSMPLFSVIPAYFLAKKHNAKLIFEVRDLWPQTPIYLKGYSKYHPVVIMMAIIEKFGYRKADVIVSVLPNAYHYIDKISKNPSKFNYIPNGIDEKLVGNLPLPEEIIDTIPNDKFIVGYAGTIGLANAMEYLIDAVKLMKEELDIHFIIVGDGYLKGKFKEETKDLNNITFIDKIKKSQVQSIVKLFDICYVGRYDSPLYKHGVSYNKYFDYMLAKKPILESSNMIKDPVELSNCGLIVKPEDAQEIKKAIMKLYNLSTEEINKFGINGHNYVKKYHNFEYLSDKYSKLFLNASKT
ncbi:MAG: glycosyltransferase family 4 protein [Flavobacteriaceae bacterium]|nr:glycosyltransferase family 4 protein [Flavobacteriaceae bacterium]